MATHLEEDDLILKRLTANDPQVIDFLFRKYFPALMKAAYAVVGNSETSRDIIQEVFANLWEKRHTLHIKKPVKAYLFRSVHNRSLNYLRDHGKTAITSLESIHPEKHAS